jgi:transposase
LAFFCTRIAQGIGDTLRTALVLAAKPATVARPEAVTFPSNDAAAVPVADAAAAPVADATVVPVDAAVVPVADTAVAPVADAEPAPVAASQPAFALPRWTLKRLVIWVAKTFGITVCRETIRKVIQRLGFSWKKGKKLLARADPAQRQSFVERIQALLLSAAKDDEQLLVYIDEAHIHQDADLGYGWTERGERAWVSSTSPGLSAKISFYGLYLYNEAHVRILPHTRGDGPNTIDVLKWLHEQYPDRKIKVIWDGAPYHRSGIVIAAAASLGIEIVRLPAYSPDFMPVEALWRWLREDVTYNHCHDTCQELIERVAAFEQRINKLPYVLADRLWVKDELDPAEEALRLAHRGPALARVPAKFRSKREQESAALAQAIVTWKESPPAIVATHARKRITVAGAV